MAAILRDSAAVVVRTRPRAIPLGFLFFPTWVRGALRGNKGRRSSTMITGPQCVLVSLCFILSHSVKIWFQMFSGSTWLLQPHYKIRDCHVIKPMLNSWQTSSYFGLEKNHKEKERRNPPSPNPPPPPSPSSSGSVHCKQGRPVFPVF